MAVPKEELDRNPTEAALARARGCFLDSANRYGCAEATLVALRECFDLPEAEDSAAAMALNGGFGYSGGTCGALTGAGLAVGQLSERRLGDHRLAKDMTRRVVQGLLDDFRGEFGSADCRDLIGIDLRAPGAHEAFIASGAWRVGCMQQIEYVVRRAAPLSSPDGGTWATVPVAGAKEAR